MSKTVGAIFILAGVGVASSLLAIGPDAEQDRRTPNSVERSTVTTVPAARPPAQSSPPVATASQSTQRRAERPPAAQPSPVVVMLPYRVQAPAPASGKDKFAGMPRDRASLARELQLELRRVGCYGGDLNGVWTPATRKAMKAFTDRVNATLPVEAPDEILLTLVQAHQGEACGRPCPSGQGLSDDGRCLPSAMLAQAAKKGASPTAPTPRLRAGQPVEKPTTVIAPWTTTTAAALPAPQPSPPAMVGRMALAGPRHDAAPPAIGESPPGPLVVPEARGPGPQSGATQRAPQAKVRERPQRFEPRAHGRRGGFVESVLLSRHSPF
jgi:hypothetical protein